MTTFRASGGGGEPPSPWSARYSLPAGTTTATAAATPRVLPRMRRRSSWRGTPSSRTRLQIGHEGLVEGTNLRVGFEDDGLSVSAGCNTLFGPYVEDDGVVRWENEPAGTLMACEPELSEQDAWLTTLFTDGMTVKEQRRRRPGAHLRRRPHGGALADRSRRIDRAK